MKDNILFLVVAMLFCTSISNAMEEESIPSRKLSFLGSGLLPLEIQQHIAPMIVFKEILQRVEVKNTLLEGYTGSINSKRVSPDGNYFLAGSGDSKVRLWNKQTEKGVYKLEQNEIIISLSFSPDGNYFLTGSYEGKARLWDVATGECLRIFEGNGSPVSLVAFSPDGNCIAMRFGNNKIRLWDISLLLEVKKQLNRIDLKQLYLLTLIDDAMQKNEKLVIEDELQEIYESLDPIIKKVIVQWVEEQRSINRNN